MIEIKVLGPTLVGAGGAHLGATALGGAKPRQLLELLALHLGNPLPKDVLAEWLWDGRPPASCIATLESYVCGLRRRLGLEGGRRSALATSDHGYLLEPEHVRVDVVAVRQLLAGDVTDVSRALDAITGGLLVDDPYAGWANEARHSFDELVAGACVRAARAANENGAPADAVRFAREADRRSYLSEPALRELMIGLTAMGARTQAIQAYEGFRAGLLDELGVEPDHRIGALYLQILRDSSAPAPGRADRDEVRTLLMLLRRALEADPGVLAGLPSMREVGQLLLARST